MTTKKLFFLFLIFFLVFTSFVFAVDPQSTTYKIRQSETVSGGKTESTNYRIVSSIGSPIGSVDSNSTTYKIYTGFAATLNYPLGSSIHYDIGGSICGDNFCSNADWDNAETCPQDCGGSFIAGDGKCDDKVGETPENSPVDCPGFCGDTYCNATAGEDSNSCPIDCEEKKELVSIHTLNPLPKESEVKQVLSNASVSNVVINVSDKVLVNLQVAVIQNVESGKKSTNFSLRVDKKNVPNAKILIEVPKSIAQKALELKFNVPIRIVVDDPLIEVDLKDVKGTEIIFSVPKEVSETVLEDLSFVAYATELVEEKACRLDLDCDDANPCTVDSCGTSQCLHSAVADGTSCGFGLVCSAGNCVEAGKIGTGQTIVGKTEQALGVDFNLVIVALVILIVVGFYFYSRETAQQKVKRLRGKRK